MVARGHITHAVSQEITPGRGELVGEVDIQVIVDGLHRGFSHPMGPIRPGRIKKKKEGEEEGDGGKNMIHRLLALVVVVYGGGTYQEMYT